MGAVLGQLLEGVALLGVEHLVLQVVGDARGGVLPLAAQPEAEVHAAVAHGEEGVASGVEGLVDHHHLQPVAQAAAEDLFPQAGIFGQIHARASFPLRK